MHYIELHITAYLWFSADHVTNIDHDRKVFARFCCNW